MKRLSIIKEHIIIKAIKKIGAIIGLLQEVPSLFVQKFLHSNIKLGQLSPVDILIINSIALPKF